MSLINYLHTKTTVPARPVRINSALSATSRNFPPSGIRSDKLIKTGAILGERFYIDRLLGAGAMGSVYSALDLGMNNRPVALKVSAEELHVRVLEAEGAVLRKLAGAANIPAYYGMGEHDGYFYLAMEFSRGQSASGRFNAKDTLTISHGVAEALAAAHTQGLIHGDLKPANIMFEVDRATPPPFTLAVPKVRLVDWGISGAQAAGLIAPGSAWGTPGYMAPEVIRWGNKADVRTDIFSLGATMYRLVTGQNPFSSEDSKELELECLRAPIPPHRKLNGELRLIVERSMAKDPNDRFQTVGDLQWSIMAALDQAA